MGHCSADIYRHLNYFILFKPAHIKHPAITCERLLRRGLEQRPSHDASVVQLRRRWRPPCWGPLCWSCRVATCCGCGWGREHSGGHGPGHLGWDIVAAAGPGAGGSRCSVSGEGLWGVEDGSVQEAWGVSEDSECTRCWWSIGCLLRCLKYWVDLLVILKES